MKLHIASAQEIAQIHGLTDPESCGAVYPLSVIQGYQTGLVLTDHALQTVLIWHCCGFANLFGKVTENILAEIAEMMQNPQPYSRMILMTQDKTVREYFSLQENFLQEERLYYRYNKTFLKTENSESTEISLDILPRIKGRITPGFSWTNDEQFLNKGKGQCVMQNGEPAAWAFSAAVSDTEIDIGVETKEAYRRCGFAAKVASAMTAYAISQGKRPVWACHAMNTGSRRLAESIGFVQCDSCTTIRYERS